MNATDSVPELAGLRRAALLAAAAGTLAALAGAIVDPTQFFRSYLVAWVYWSALGLGCLGLLMVYHLTGGGWGVAIRRLLEAGIATLPAAALLFVPVLFGLGAIYAWTDRAAVLADHVLSQKAAYLDVPFFIGRAAAYFLVWLALAHFLDRKLVTPPLFVQTIFGILGGIGPDPQNVLMMRETAERLFGDQYHWSVLAAGRFQLPFTTMAATMGANVRVGLEDNLFLGKGKLAPSNAALVAKIRHILEELSIDIASADEARAMLDTKGAANVKF